MEIILSRLELLQNYTKLIKIESKTTTFFDQSKLSCSCKNVNFIVFWSLTNLTNGVKVSSFIYGTTHVIILWDIMAPGARYFFGFFNIYFKHLKYIIRSTSCWRNIDQPQVKQTWATWMSIIFSKSYSPLFRPSGYSIQKKRITWPPWEIMILNLLWSN